jgi:hypothetical protein
VLRAPPIAALIHVDGFVPIIDGGFGGPGFYTGDDAFILATAPMLAEANPG